MKKSIMKPLSIFLCAAFIIGSVGASVYALTNEENNEPAQTQTAIQNVEEETQEITKDETVYVLAGADGSVEKIIVSDWIKNSLGSIAITDKSELSDVVNSKGDETYTMNGDNMRVWDAQGKDIYYQGNIEKELPVNLSVSYTMDGNMISPSELAGKSGHLVIRFDYENNQYENVEIDGKTERIYVPYVMLTGMLLDTDIFSNVEVSNGKLINDGDHIAVAGIAFPGLQSNLAIDKSKLEIPEYVEISADVENFEMTTTMTIATNDIFNQLDGEKLGSLDSLTVSLDEMSNAMNQLMDGSSQLYDGLCTLLNKSGELIAGIDKLVAGAQELKAGAGDLDAGAGKLQEGATRLYEGLCTLSANNATLNGGAKQVFDTLLSTANTQIAAAGINVPTLTVENYAEVLNGVIASLDENAVYQAVLAQVTAAVEANRPTIESRVTEAVKTQVTVQVTTVVRETVAEQVIPVVTNGQMTKETYDAAVADGTIDPAVQAAVEGAIDAQMESESVQNTIANTVEEQMQTQTIQAIIEENVELQIAQAIAEAMASETVQNQLNAACEGAKAMISLKASLDSYNAFYLGLLTYTSGVADAANGAGALKNGTEDLKVGSAKLYDGIGELYNGILQVKNGSPALVDGITQLRDGSMMLSDGLKEFNEQGVQRLVDAVEGDLGVLTTRMRATIDVSKNYKSFSGLSENMDGQVKFIYRTEGIKISD